MKKTRLFNFNYIAIILTNVVAQFGYSMVSANIASYAAEVGAAGAMLGLIPGLMSIGALCVRPLTGALSDRVNRKRIMVCSMCGLFLVFIGYAFSNSVEALVIVRVFHGICYAFFTTANLAIVADLVPAAQLSAGIGYYGLATTVVSAFAPGVGVYIQTNLGFQWMFVTAALFYLASILLSGIIRYSVEPGSGHGGEVPKKFLSGLIAWKAVPPALIAFCNAFTNGALTSFIVLYAAERGIRQAGLYFTISAVVIILFRPLFGKLADRVQPQYLVYPCGCAIIAALVCLYAAHTSTVLWFAAALFGFGYGGLQPLMQSMCIRSVPPEQHGAASGTCYLALDGGNALGPIVCGAVAAAGGSYSYGFLSLIIPVLLGFAVMAGIVINKTFYKPRRMHYEN